MLSQSQIRHQRKYRQERYDNGLCVVCGKENTRLPCKLCNICKDKHNIYMKERRQKMKGKKIIN